MIASYDDLVGGPRISFGPRGNAYAVWPEWGAGNGTLWSSQWTEHAEWTTPEVLTKNNENPVAPEIAVDGQGNAYVVWNQNDGLRENVWAIRYSSEYPVPEFGAFCLVSGVFLILAIAPRSLNYGRRGKPLPHRNPRNRC